MFEGTLYDSHEKLETLFETNLEKLESFLLEMYYENKRGGHKENLIKFNEKSVIKRYEYLNLTYTGNLMDLARPLQLDRKDYFYFNSLRYEALVNQG